MKTFVVLQIWDGDCIDPDIIGIYATAEKANQACYEHVKKWARCEPTNLCEGEDLAHWEFVGDFKLESAKVIDYELDASAWPEGCSCEECNEGREEEPCAE